MIDLHCHVLPGVDDGPPALADAIAMCRLAAADGCATLVATPHLRHPSFPQVTRRRLEKAREELVAALAGDGPEVRLGAEVRVDSELLAELESSSHEVLSLADSHYLLLELPRVETGAVPEELVHELAVAGWRPILAHPEVIPWLDVERAVAVVAAGALLQVTAAAVTGEFGRQPHQRVWELLDAGIVHFVASDSHSPSWRVPGLSAARQILARRLGEESARQLVADNPARVLADVPLSVGAAASYRSAG